MIRNAMEISKLASKLIFQPCNRHKFVSCNKKSYNSERGHTNQEHWDLYDLAKVHMLFISINNESILVATLLTFGKPNQKYRFK